MKKGLGCLVTLVLVVGVVVGGYQWVQYQVHTPVSSTSEKVTLTIRPNESESDIAAALQAKGVIRDQRIFQYYLHFTGTGADIQAGQVTVNRNMSMPQVANALSNAHTASLQVRLGEGLTIAPMAQQAEQQGAGPATTYESLADDRTAWAAQFPFLGGLPATAPNTLEGFLFPNTYQLLPSEGAKGLITRQLQAFQQSVQPLLPGLAQPTAARPAESLYSVLILASITEKEVNAGTDRSIVCGIFYNRLAQGIPLGSDATVLFALGRSSGSLSATDLQVNSPYNTRVNPGLPPGPISNPSLDSITACANPQPSNYLYFFTDPQGVAHYAATYADFEAQQQQYGVGTP